MEPRPEKYEVRTPFGVRAIPEKYETWTPFGRIVLAVLAIAAVALFVIMGRAQNPPETPEKSEPDICEGLTRLQCWEARDLERRQQEYVEQLQDADMMP